MTGQPSNHVKLYVYDLSRGMAKSMSLALTGKQLDGIWHTSVVAFGREIFYGRGIMEATPGTTHHGQPQQVIDCGETFIDDETFQEYLISLSDLYTPSAYHLTDFNCNNFTADVVGFLTGSEIPSWISGLPAEFLSTPLGQMIRPQIDAMFQSSNSAEHSAFTPPRTQAATPQPQAAERAAPSSSSAANPQDLASAFLSAVAQQATTNGGPSSTPAKPSPVTAALTLVTSQTNFSSILTNHSAVVVNFTNTQGCAPCRAIKPAYESIAETNTKIYGPKGARFVEVELGVGQGHSIASQYGVSATPTFMFFKSGKKVDEMRGADRRGLENRVEAFLDDCFPQHPHKRLYLAATSHISTQPITAATTPAYPALLAKLEAFPGADKTHVGILRNQVIPFLEKKTALNDAGLMQLVDKWTAATTSLLSTLKPADTFPVIDLWRIGLLNTRIVSVLTLRLSPASPGPNAIGPILALAAAALRADTAGTPRPFLLTTLRLATNLLAPLPLANTILSPAAPLQADLLAVVVDSLLHPEVSVRKAAADVAVNAATWRHRIAKERAAAEGTTQEDDDGIDADWEVELLSALLEAIAREADPEVGHRELVATALLTYLSPAYVESIKPLLEVLDAAHTVQEAGKRWGKKDARKLADEFATKLC